MVVVLLPLTGTIARVALSLQPWEGFQMIGLQSALAVEDPVRGGSDVLVARVEELTAQFRARITETDRLCRLPDETIAELEQADLFGLLKPRRYGGHQLELDDYMDVIVALGRADVSVAWVVNLISITEWMVASSFSHAVQEVVFGSANPRIAGVLHPFRCQARRVDGGVIIDSGMWRFNSGIYHAGWDLLACPLPGADSSVDYSLVLLPVSEVRVLNDWDTAGIRGSGSSSVEVSDVFVPEERICSMATLLGGNQGLWPAAEDFHFRRPIGDSTVLLSLPMLGGCDAALETFLASIAGRRIQHSLYADAAAAPTVHRAVGEASAKIDGAKLITRAVLAQMEQCGRRGVPSSLAQSSKMRRDSGLVAQMAWEGVDLLADCSGASMMANRHPLNRIWRDVRTGTLHAAHAPMTHFENYGRMACGIDSGEFLG